MTIDKINPDDKELRFRDLINTINDTIDELNSASNVHYVKKAGDVVQGTLTANGTQGVVFAATGGGFSRPITFEDNNIPFNNTSGTTVAFLSTQGSFNLTGRINFVETSASPYSWRFLPDYGNNELKVQGANNTTIMTITDSHVKFENDVEIEEDLILGGKATVGAQASGAWDVMPKHQVEALFLPKTGGEITGNLTVGGEFTYGRAKIITDADLNDLTVPGFYVGNNLTNAPNSSPGLFYIEVQRTNYNNNFVYQRATAVNHSGYATWVRNRDAGVWYPWRQVWDSQNADAYTKTVADDRFVRKDMTTVQHMSGPLNVRQSLGVRANPGQNVGIALTDESGNEVGLIYATPSTGFLGIRRKVEGGSFAQLKLLPDSITYNDQTIYNVGHKASVADYRANVSDKILTTDTVWNAAAVRSIGGGAAGETLSAGAHTPDFGTGINFYNHISGNVTINNPTNAKPGQSGVIALRQDETGGRTISFGSNWKFANNQPPTIDTTAHRMNTISYFVLTPTYIIASVIPGMV